MTGFGSAASPPQMTIGQILNRIYRLMRVYWRTFFEIALIPAAVIMGAAIAAIGCVAAVVLPQILRHGDAAPHIPIYLPAIFVAALYLIQIPTYALYLPAGMYAATQANLGVKVSLREAYAMAWRHYGRYLGLMLLIALYVWIPLAVIGALIGGGAILIAHSSRDSSIPVAIFMLAPAAFLAYLGMMVYCIFIMLRFSLAYPACVVEEIPARAALRRSTWLTSGARGRILLVLLAVYAATYVFSMIFVSVCGTVFGFGMMAAIAAHVTVGSPAFWILIGLGGLAYFGVMVIYSALAYAAFNAALAVLYHDLRWRKDAVSASVLPA